MTQDFLPGLELSRIFFAEAVQPILTHHFPELPYSAGLIGPGSEVQGFDTPQSMDHDWGPRLVLFLSEREHTLHSAALDAILRAELPTTIRGFATNFSPTGTGVRWMQPVAKPPIDHNIKVMRYPTFFTEQLNCDPTLGLAVLDWLIAPQQVLRELTGGQLFHDALDIAAARAKLRYYPHDIWLYMLAAQWVRIGQEDAFVGRCAQTGDELGSRLIANRLIRDIMRLCYLFEQQYAPYSKWLGTAFARLDCATQLTPIFLGVLNAQDWTEREQHLCAACESIAQLHNALQISQPGPTRVSHFHDRPFRVIQAEQFAQLTRAAISDPAVLALPAHIGAIDQFVDSTDVLSNPAIYGRLKATYLDEVRH